MSLARRSARLGASGVVALALALLQPLDARGAPPEAPAREAETGRVVGRVREAGTRTPIPDIDVMLVAAPAEVRVGAPARAPLDPAQVTWTRRATTDAEGRFEVENVPLGKVRVVVVASGYPRLELWGESRENDPPALHLFLKPERDGAYRTEVVSDRDLALPQAEHQVDGARGRVYPGSGGDPVRAAQNLPGVARAPMGLGLVAVRGGDPRQTALYVDGHPVPRAFHVLPIAAVVEPSMVERVELTPGNYDAAYGGVSGGLLEIHTRSPSGTVGIHGEGHLDLFDVGAGIRAPVGPGGVAFAFRRAHLGDVVKAADSVLARTGILLPNYWDYFGRFDLPIGGRHRLSVKAFGAGDALQDATRLDDYGNHVSVTNVSLRAAFHRFDLGYEFEGARLRASVSGALRLDDSTLDEDSNVRSRRGRTLSFRGVLSYELVRRATLLAGLDLVDTHAKREHSRVVTEEQAEFEARNWRLGAWLGVAFTPETRAGPLLIRPQVRLNVFGTSSEARVRPDPRLDLRARVHPRVELFAAIGQYSAPITLVRDDQFGLINSTRIPGARIIIPDWLISYFDPGVASEAGEGLLIVTRTMQSSVGIQLELPWSLDLRATAFWRERPSEKRGWRPRPSGDESEFYYDIAVSTPAERAYGLELLLDRRLAEGVHGMIGYTLLRARAAEIYGEYVYQATKLLPAPFDQRHNLVALIVFELPRGFRFGARFRLASGNPERPVIGTIIDQDRPDDPYQPIYGEFGSSYRPLFHQLDLRLDKSWVLRRLSVVAYLDVQNVYNHLYPEIWVYSTDWGERGQRIGLPIFPSLGVRVEF